MTLTLLFVATALVAPNVSRTARVTVICSDVAPAGNGPLPSRPQSVVGESVGVVVFCDFVPATLYVQLHWFRVPPGDAVEALPLNVQSSVVPPLFTRQVLLPLGPETVKLAMGTVGAAVVTVRVAVAFRLPAEALIATLLKLPPTARVFTVNVAVVWPAGIVTFAGTVTGSLLDSVTTMPPAGAGEEITSVPVTGLPPTTDDALKVRPSTCAAPCATVMLALPWLPLAVAVIVDVPAATPVTVNVADVWPAATVTDPGTVATAVLLLVSVTVAPVVADKVTVP